MSLFRAEKGLDTPSLTLNPIGASTLRLVTVPVFQCLSHTPTLPTLPRPTLTPAHSNTQPKDIQRI